MKAPFKDSHGYFAGCRSKNLKSKKNQQNINFIHNLREAKYNQIHLKMRSPLSLFICL